MSARNKPLSAFLILGIIVLVSFRSKAEGQQGSVTIPSLQVLRLLDYSKGESANQTDTVGYAELQEVINACKAYSKGVDVLPRFHEPILTRGDTGIAVFRKVSPSVVMVLTANFKDDKIQSQGSARASSSTRLALGLSRGRHPRDRPSAWPIVVIQHGSCEPSPG